MLFIAVVNNLQNLPIGFTVKRLQTTGSAHRRVLSLNLVAGTAGDCDEADRQCRRAYSAAPVLQPSLFQQQHRLRACGSVAAMKAVEGARGKRLLLGSQVNGVLAHSNVQVLIVR